ncbi:hypothetical protein LTR91_002572 [Friedmanniomyces endolithicus]|uniref:Yeast cell wall synthesis Kre9/Knh1-like N-terminal domain-containing protein n=1 Tax=Friedmanniomyces endolithicus TaxID=329885 RepID=A0A4U0UNQ6_9PEZI|nr:hypothetical protein LTS09_009288 [Friedmanniomyces endolithicus]KAK0286203.1 hypothetical protein LTR35_004637 [Friedmanniomyces endolithicus]KAK0299103.1 hypothetical protein LTS00_002213 [Friedmanniomyces endolithicus]KAK0322797.1 hypothetical protein LTR82_006254 [Friedmanniomyces endolithicus]KAK0920475.1 hypothetical protein LTR57_009731 [Friedmanniomyces endolithicus]
MLSKLLLASAFAAIAAAQSKVLNFTAVPAPFTDGQAYALTYATNDTTSPVTIVLLQGPSATGLQPIATLNADIHGGQYVWTPPTTLPAGNDYALQILQGNQVNYYGPFQILAATAPASSSTSSTATSSSATTTAAANPLGPVVVSPSSVSTNGSVSATLPATLVGTAMSAGTGVAMPRNTTMAMATLSSSSSVSVTAVVPVTTAVGSTASSTAAVAVASASATGAMPATTNSASGMDVGGVLSVVLGVAGVVVYLL